MRALMRNKQRFYFAKYVERAPITDEYGNETGEYAVQYSKPIEAYGNISAATGETQVQQFGETINYDKVIVMEKGNSQTDGLDEYAVLWVEQMPELKSDGTTHTPHNYVVTKIAHSLNVISIAISKVNAGE